MVSSPAGASGSAIHRIKYRNKFKPPSARKANTQRIRISLASMPKCSASPPQTPAIFLFVPERIRRFVSAPCATPLAAGDAAETLGEDAAARPESVSRCRRFKSARSSAATWYRMSRSFSSALFRMRSSSAGISGFNVTGATGA